MLPLLSSLDALLDDEGQAEQRAFFARIRDGLAAARDPDDLAAPFMELSTSAFLGFRYSPAAVVLVDEILSHAQELAELLSSTEETLH